MSYSLEEAVRARLLTDTEIQALLATRIYPAPAPHKAETPWAAYQRISSPESYMLEGTPYLANIRIQYSFVASTWKAAKDALDLCRGVALSSVMRGTFSGVVIDSVFVADARDMGRDLDTGLYRHDMDLEILQQL